MLNKMEKIKIMLKIMLEIEAIMYIMMLKIRMILVNIMQ